MGNEQSGILPENDMTERSSNSLPATPASVRRVLGGRRSSGIVTVVKRDSRDAGSSIEDDPEMQRLRQIPKFGPLIQASTSTNPNVPTLFPSSKDESISSIALEPVMDLMDMFQSHTANACSYIAQHQKEVELSVKQLEQQFKQTETALTRQNQDIAVWNEKMVSVYLLSKHLKTTHANLAQMFDLVESIQQLLPGDNPHRITMETYPILCSLMDHRKKERSKQDASPVLPKDLMGSPGANKKSLMQQTSSVSLSLEPVLSDKHRADDVLAEGMAALEIPPAESQNEQVTGLRRPSVSSFGSPTGSLGKAAAEELKRIARSYEAQSASVSPERRKSINVSETSSSKTTSPTLPPAAPDGTSSK